jgi:TolB-like protein/Flp pilus assembly protein TadD
MFTDMVGYTALGQRDESLSMALVEEHRKVVRPILARHNGREVKTMGDAFLIEFPNAVDAMRCAYDIQRAIREFNLALAPDKRIHLRVGVHVGEVVESAGDISGDAVNIASRIEPLAEDGGVCMTRQVHDLVKNKLDIPILSLGMKSLKNVAEPMEVYRMVMPWEKEKESATVFAPGELDKNRVAVLPFANMSPDPNDEYFSDGMTEELITSLAGVNGLSVIARASVMKYKGGSKGAYEVASELKAGTLIEGSVRKAGNRIRITVQLIDGRTESHAWAQIYDRELDDIFAIQSDVAKQVTNVLQVKLLSEEKKRLEKAPTSNIEAYTLYLKGQHYQSGFEGVEGLRRAVRHFEEAVSNDPTFALAHARLSLCYNQLGFYGIEPSSDSGRKARLSADRALELDEKLAESHHAKGAVLRNYDWDFIGASREFRRAAELKPSYVAAYGAIASLLMFNRQFEESLLEISRMLELDPKSGTGSSYAGTVYLYLGRNEEAVEMYSKALEVNPKSTFDLGNRALARIRMGLVDEGLRELQSVAQETSASSLNDLAYAYARAGKSDEVRTLLDKCLRDVESKPELAIPIACAYANLGDSGKAMQWLEKSFRLRLPFLPSINADFAFDAIRSDERFQALMRRIGFTNVG